MPHDKNRQPFVGSGREIEGGALALRRQDFTAHAQGNFARHAATDVDMHDQLTSQLGGALADPTVQGTLEKIADILNCVGNGFITVGDGYGAACGTQITIGDPGIPTLEAAFTEAFTNPRLQNGGIILLKAGTYRLSTTVTVPAGISIMGEVGGTIIIGETPELSMFRISRSVTRPTINPAGDQAADPLDKTTFFNLTLADNLDGYAAGGDPSLQTVPMIVCERGSHFSCDQVTFLGRMGTLGAGPTFGRIKTLRAIGYTTGGTEQTVLRLEKCTLDSMRNAVDFSPGGNTDVCVIDKCKIRVFGSENVGQITDRSIQTFFTTVGGDIRITNNLLISDTANSLVATVLTITSGFPNVSITGNQGRLNTDPADNFTGPHALIANTAGNTINTLISGNNFDNRHIQNEWFVTIGDGTNSIGDITGPNAIATLLGYADDNEFINVIINSGEYNLSANTQNNLKFIGNKRANQYPLIKLTGSFSMGSSAAGVHFKNNVASTATLTFNFNRSGGATTLGGTIYIDDCMFTDVRVSLQAPDSTAVDPFASIAQKSHQIVKNCQFINTSSTTNDFVSLIINSGDMTTVENCIFNGNGYALNINDFAAGTIGSQITVNNCIMDLTGSTISTNIIPYYIYINAFSSRVLMQNCRVLADNTLSERTNAIDAGLSTTFLGFVRINSTETTLNNNIVVGPHQTFDDGGALYAMPACKLTSTQSIYVDKCRFMGALPLQITGVNLLDDDTNKRGITITYSEFSNADTANDITLTLLDIDYDIQAITANTVNPRIDVESCLFTQKLASNSRPVLHEINDPDFNAHYITQGIVQIYAGLANINVTNNTITGNLTPFGSVDGTDPNNPYNNFAGIHVDGYNLETFSASIGIALSTVNVTNNVLNIFNDYDTPNTTEYASALSVISTMSRICDNYLALINSGTTNIDTGGAGGAQNFASSLVLFNAPLDNTDFAEAVITGNTFSRRDTLGIAFPHKIATVVVLAGSTDGICIDNTFTERDVDGLVNSSSVQFFGPIPPLGKWTFERNKNQLALEEIRAVTGRILISNSSASSIPTGSDPDNVLNFIQVANAVSTETFVVVNERGSGAVSYEWNVALRDTIPLNVQIVNALIDNSGNDFAGESGSASAVFTVSSNNATASSTTDLLATGAGFRMQPTLTSGSAIYNSIGTNALAKLRVSVNVTGGSTTLTASWFGMIVLYSW